MAAQGLETLDAVVIGANIRGLITTYLLSSLGYRAVLIERARRVGGADSSFVTADGTRFEHGLHLLDAMRSEVATRLFLHVVGGKVHEFTLRRGIVLRNQIMSYAPLPADMPVALREMLPSDDLVDDLGDELPTRERLSRYYGRAFTDLIFDEVLPSYHCEARHLAFGVDEAKLLTNVYPWFFPRAVRRGTTGDESRAFHDQLRHGIEQRVLYPHDGGFGGFAEGFVKHFEPQRIELLTGADDVHVELARGTHTVEWVGAGGRRFAADHYFWAGPWSALCGVLDLPCQEVATDRVLLGSFRLNRPANTEYHEILVGDPQHRINRVYFPASFRNSDDPLMQIEFAVPNGESWSLDADHWRDVWLGDVRRLGLMDNTHRVEEFDFRSFRLHFNSFGVEGEALRDADPALLRPDSNVYPVIPSMANLNLNAYVPRVAPYVASVLAATPHPG